MKQVHATRKTEKKLISTVQLFLYQSFQHFWQSLHSFGKEHVTLWGNLWRPLNALKCRSHSAEDAGIDSNLLALADNKGCDCSCCPHQWSGWKPSVTTWDGKGSVSYFRISFSTRSFNGSIDAIVVDADVTSVSPGAPWKQPNGPTFSFSRIGSGTVVMQVEGHHWQQVPRSWQNLFTMLIEYLVMGQHAPTHDPCDPSKSDPFDPLTHDPSIIACSAPDPTPTGEGTPPSQTPPSAPSAPRLRPPPKL